MALGEGNQLSTHCDWADGASIVFPLFQFATISFRDELRRYCCWLAFVLKLRLVLGRREKSLNRSQWFG